MNLNYTIGATLLCAALASGQAAPQKGAKALFYDPTSQVTLSGTSGTAPTPKPIAPGQRGAVSSQPVATAAPTPKANTGLMYYVELIKPNGEILRVNASRIFRSGEKIRLHFQSNVDGRLVIVQRDKDGSAQKLYPDARINRGENRIRAGMDTIIPSEKAWFTFDNNPGVERLMVFLATESGYEMIKTEVAAPKIDNDNTVKLASRITTQQRGSKALVLEVDDKSDSPATYAVAPVISPSPRSSPSNDSEIVALEIVLNHQQ